MIITLQRYVAKELFKTFALTAVGLTLTFSLCGGVMNMIQAEVLTAVQLLHILGYVLPISMTLTLPISALFACAIVYGRLAADNEFDACKASGVNILHLLAPAFALSIATAAFTYTFTNHLLPKVAEQLDKMVRRDLQKLVYQALSSRGYLKHGGYVLYAGKTFLYDQDADFKTIHIQRAAFLEMEDGKLMRCGTADEARVDFATAAEGGMPTVQASLSNIRSFDVGRNQFFDVEHQPFDPMQIPQEVELEPKWLTLPQLLYYHDHPLELYSIREELAQLRALVRKSQFYKYAYEQLTGPDKVLRLADDNISYEIRAERVYQDQAPDNLRPKLRGVTIKEKEVSGNGWRKHTADTCTIDVDRSGFGAGPNVVIPALRGNVTTIDSVDPEAHIERTKRDLEKVTLPDTLPGMPELPDDQTLLGDLSVVKQDLPSLELGDRVDDARKSDRGEIFKIGQEIVGIIHSRLAFSASSLVILVLAATLGIIFRGGQLLTAFVIAFVPGLLVVVMNIMGRQLTENTGTHAIGIIVIWAGIAILAAADVVVMGKYLKR